MNARTLFRAAKQPGGSEQPGRWPRATAVLSAAALLVLTAAFQHAQEQGQADSVPEPYREMVRKGLEFLVKHQCADGHWEGDGGKHPVAMTGLVGLALHMEKGRRNHARLGSDIYYPNSPALTKAVDWLIEKSMAGRDGLIFSDHPSEITRYMEGHGLATIFLAGATQGEFDNARMKKLTDTITRSVKYIAKAQSGRGGWYHTSKVEGHDFEAVLPTVIQFQAIRAASNVGISLSDREQSNDPLIYLHSALKKLSDDRGAGNKRTRLLETAAALAAHHRPVDLADVAMSAWVPYLEYCQSEIRPGPAVDLGRDELIHYYYAQVLFHSSSRHLRENKSNNLWETYRTALFENLKKKQNQDGSWPSAEGLSVGSVYATAIWCTILQLDRDRHPSIRAPFVEAN